MRPGLATTIFLVFVIAVSSALAGGDAKRFTVSSSLDGKRVLPLTQTGRARPRRGPRSRTPGTTQCR
jgi:hypothetical protein